MKKSVLLIIGCSLLTGCVTTTSTIDPTTKALMEMNLQNAKQTKEIKKVTIEVLSKDNKKYSLEANLNSDGSFTIPAEKVETRYELKIN